MSQPEILEEHRGDVRASLVVGGSLFTLSCGEVVREDGKSVLELRDGTVFRVGRSDGNDLVVNDQNVSRFHAVFSVSSSGVVLSDLSSLNGTFVNSTRITTPVELKDGDRVSIGPVDMAFSLACVAASSGQDLFQEQTTQTTMLSPVGVTVLIADVCGYTKYSEQLPQVDVAAMLNSWFETVSLIIENSDGEVDKYIGDCVMAVWKEEFGATSDAAIKAVLCASRIIAETDALSVSGVWPHHINFPWQCRVALNTGEALLGSVGGRKKRDYTVLGDTVNLAFRLEGLAGTLGEKLILGQKTAESIGGFLPLNSLGPQKISGREEAVEAYSLDWRLALRNDDYQKCREKTADLLKEFCSLPICRTILLRLEQELPPELLYHSVDHTRGVMAEAVLLAYHDGKSDRELELLAVAAAYHDAGFLIRHEDNEELGAQMAKQAMLGQGGYTPEERELVGSLILDTKLVATANGPEQQASQELSGYLLDADLANLGREDFFDRLEALCAERNIARSAALPRVRILLLNHCWSTPAARYFWEGKKQENLSRVLSELSEEAKESSSGS